ncbi:MAG: response regulator [Deltaproteobacteria bacterium]
MIIVHIHTFADVNSRGSSSSHSLPAYLSVRDREDNSRTYVTDRGDETTMMMTFGENDSSSTLILQPLNMLRFRQILRPDETPVGHGETVLVVEDELALLTIDKIMLDRLGYRVLTAGTPGDAIRIAAENAGGIHLVLTDVVMPEINGRELALRLQSLAPGIKILFMSGYTADVIARRGVLDEGVNFIQKPFSMKDLAVKVRDVLDDRPQHKE